MMDPMEGISVAASILVNESPGPTVFRFKCLKSHRESSRTKPLDQKLLICECFKNEFSGRVKLPCDEDLLLARFCHNSKKYFHPSLQTF